MIGRLVCILLLKKLSKKCLRPQSRRFFAFKESIQTLITIKMAKASVSALVPCQKSKIFSCIYKTAVRRQGF